MSTTDQWYCARGQKRVGPFETDKLQSLIRSGKIRSTDLVRRDGTSDWTPVSQWQELVFGGPSTAIASGSRPRVEEAKSRSLICPRCDHTIHTIHNGTAFPSNCSQCGLELAMTGNPVLSSHPPSPHRQGNLSHASAATIEASASSPVPLREVSGRPEIPSQGEIDLEAVAIAQKLLLLSVVPVLVAIFLWPPLLLLWPLRLVVVLLQLAAIVRLCRAMKLPLWKMVVALLAALIPLLAMIPLLGVFSFFWLNMKATRVLRQGGVEVGFLGVSRSRIVSNRR